MRRVDPRSIRCTWGLLVALVTVFSSLGLSGSVSAANQVPPGVPAPEQRGVDHVSGQPLPTVQINGGVIWAQAVTGDVVFAGGSFSGARPAGAKIGQAGYDRTNILAYNIKTGEILPFNPRINGVVKSMAVSPDGSRLYVGGSFTKVNNQPRWLIAAFDIATGKLLESFQAALGGSTVNAISVTKDAVYVGGLFTQANGLARKNLAAFRGSGSLLPWAPVPNQQVDALFATADGGPVIIGGRFNMMNGVESRCSASVDGISGTRRPWGMGAPLGVCTTGSSGVMGFSSADGRTVYAAGWAHNTYYYEGVWAADIATGKPVWYADGWGDIYDVFASPAGVIAVGHSHLASPFGGWPDHRTPSGTYQFAVSLTLAPKGSAISGGRANLMGAPSPAITHWYPSFVPGEATQSFQAGWTVEGNKDYVVIGGEFLDVNGVPQQGLVRFARPGLARSTQGPVFSGAPDVRREYRWESPEVKRTPGGVTVTITPNYDRDDRSLTYELYRSDTTQLVATVTSQHDPWRRTEQRVTLRDPRPESGQQVGYTVRAIDGDGNHATSATTSLAPGGVAPMRAVARDGFERTGTSWGQAELGGLWTVSGNVALEGGAGVIRLPRGQASHARLNQVKAQNTDIQFTVSLDRVPVGGGTYISAASRCTTTGDYRVKTVFNPGGTVSLFVVRTVNNAETILAGTVIKGMIVQANERYQVRYQSISPANGTTVLQAKIWKNGTPEPGAWQVSSSDATPGLQGSGSVGLVSYVSSKSAESSQNIRYWDYASEEK